LTNVLFWMSMQIIGLSNHFTLSWRCAVELTISGDAWNPWNFTERINGPSVPPGTYEVVKTTIPSTGRAAILLAQPQQLGVPKGTLVGEDEEFLRKNSKRILCVLQLQ